MIGCFPSYRLKPKTASAAGNIVESTDYLPFGGQRLHSGTVDSNYKFTDQEFDPETGLYYYGARYYDPTLGRFISADTVVQDFSDPQMLNRYSYARNNPLLYADPSGHFIQIVIGAIIGAVIGGVVSALTGGKVGMGILTGAIGGAFFGAACMIVGPVTSAGVTFAEVVRAAAIYAVAGAAAGAVNSAIYGGNIGQGALYGAIGGAIGGAAGVAAAGVGEEIYRITLGSAAYANIRRSPFGSGIGSPNSFAVAIHSWIASPAFFSALPGVAPCAMHPGSSGTSATYTSSCLLQ